MSISSNHGSFINILMSFIFIINNWGWVQGGSDRACIGFPDNLQEPAATSTVSHQAFMQFSHSVFAPERPSLLGQPLYISCLILIKASLMQWFMCKTLTKLHFGKIMVGACRQMDRLMSCNKFLITCYNLILMSFKGVPFDLKQCIALTRVKKLYSRGF